MRNYNIFILLKMAMTFTSKLYYFKMYSLINYIYLRNKFITSVFLEERNKINKVSV